ncbi:alpha-N-acetylgalactosaminide alpha-2,6-sialyltransferase 1 isoform X1 [Herpailurus yagouaroundi]|uniref:alpha-N-acetylgalactosaminide alpha-2,6-sialyltransferase 1 isoform X1 n=1 Tax=Herpailurus yagouaroundi TaxID=1608482 RepID=UPI001AD795BC|nr:alpha-N-acetylgalactosaminide alpha-2,6-sialyltransferase 1 isoform X1 [Puma yagouaroundi]XP_040312447.1 alpha-N-acetylgalactosaminide alpha-2,6-sialyltransferase 1 isoform X1 [Puma yagouaroundi]
MRTCLRRPSRLGQAVQWLLLLAVLISLFFVLPSLVKEPDTKPFRRQHMDDEERSSGSPHKSAQQAPPREGRTAAPASSSARGNSVQVPPAQATAHPAKGDIREETGGATSTGPAPPRGRKRKDTVLDTRPPRARDGGVASEALSLRSQDARTTKGRQDQNGEPTATRTVPSKPRAKAATTARTPVPESQAEALTTPGAGPLKGVASAVMPRRETPRAKPPSTPRQARTTQRSRSLRAANFKSEPRWDFEEQYSFDVGALQTTCPDSVKVKASKSPWLQTLFLANLTLFLDSSHFNRSEWDRLEHFAPPFGFMELNYSLVQKVVTRFPPVPQQQLLLAGLPAGSSQCITCAVVGNGGILNNSHVGREIDSHDHVFRLSGAVTKGYEQDVGTRTSFYGFTAFSLTQSLMALDGQGFRHVPLGKDVRYLHFLEGTRDYEWLEAMFLNQSLVKTSLSWFRHRPQVAFQGDPPWDRYLLLHPDSLRYMKNRFLRSKTLDTVHWRIYRPTTGALLLLTALQLCDQVSAYGFITEGHEQFSDHYYDKSWKKTVFYINHDFQLERTLWKRLHDEGIIQLYQRSVTSKPKM